VGLGNNQITLKFGKHDTPYKLLGYKIPQILAGSLGDITGFTGIYHRVDQRPSNALLLQTRGNSWDLGYMYARETLKNPRHLSID
jgi:hypothetical protein